jgi:hypothetical protein
MPIAIKHPRTGAEAWAKQQVNDLKTEGTEGERLDHATRQDVSRALKELWEGGTLLDAVR